MPVGTPAPLNKRKKPSKIITDLSHISQDEFESEPEASEFDLGTKIRTPKEIMLEELSLMKNRGSKMFKMRQKRVEKFIYENNPDVFTTNSMDNFQKFVPSLGGQIGGQFINVGGHHVSKEATHLYVGAPVPPPKPGSKGGETGRGDSIGGAGDGGLGGDLQSSQGDGMSNWSSSKGAGKDGKSKTLTAVKTYISPWEKAMKGDEGLLATLKSEMPSPIERKDLPKYKSFNRMAIPFGGFDKASQLMKFQLPETEMTKEDPEPAVLYQHEIGCRPSFNRTPIGWVATSEPSSIHMETDAVPFDGETDEL